MTDEYESFIKSEQNKDAIGVKHLSDFKTLHNLKVQNKAYDYEEIEVTAYESTSANSWNINCSFIKGSPKDALSESVYTLDEIDSLKQFIGCIRNLLMDILVDEKTGLRN